jgi:hypothetical protein
MGQPVGNHKACVKWRPAGEGIPLALASAKLTGLDAAARGMGVAGKPEGMTGELALVLWARGEREKVLKYVCQDVKTTMEVARVSESCGELRWVSRSGMRRSLLLPEGWLPVSEARELPLPDTSWVTDPWPRERFTEWMGPKPNCSGD